MMIIADRLTDAQVDSVSLRIAQEAGCSSGRVYESDILTKMGILNELVHKAATAADAIEKNAMGLWRFKWRGLERLQELTTFRCPIKGICLKLVEHWPSANHAIATVKKSLRWLEDLGIVRLNDEIETPICTVSKETEHFSLEFKSPDKLFLDFNVDLALEAYQALEQLRSQYAKDTPRADRRRKTVKDKDRGNVPLRQRMPDHGGMLVRMVYGIVRGRQYRPFSKLPDSVADLGYSTRQSQDVAIAKAMSEVSELTRQIAEHARYSGDAYKQRIAELERLRAKAEQTIAALEREMAFAQLPY